VALTTLYFGNTAAGAGDGSSYANRAKLWNAGNTGWSTLVTGHNFGTNGMLALLAPETYTVPAALTSGIFTVSAPSVIRMLEFNPCGTDGSVWQPDLGWRSAQGNISTTGMAEFNCNAGPFNLANTVIRGIRITYTSSASPLLNFRILDWCCVDHSGNGTTAYGVSTGNSIISNCQINMTGTTSYGAGINSTSDTNVFNCRVIGNRTASSGNRVGVQSSLPGATIMCVVNDCTILNNDIGIFINNATGSIMSVNNNTLYHNYAGFYTAVSSSVAPGNITQNMIVGDNTALSNGIFFSNTTHIVVPLANRVRDFATLFGTGLAHTATTQINYTDAGTDADEFVDVSSGDYRIKLTSDYWGKRIGAGDEALTGTAGIIVHPGFGGGFRS